jgi:hypothetical protein
MKNFSNALKNLNSMLLKLLKINYLNATKNIKYNRLKKLLKLNLKKIYLMFPYVKD